MNKDEQLLKILDNSSCLRKRQMLSYINKELFPEELRAVELHLVGCNLCNDAIEGLEKLQNINHDLDQLSLPPLPKIEFIEKKFEKKKVEKPISSLPTRRKKDKFKITGSLGIAALIAVGFFSIYYFEYRPNKKQQNLLSITDNGTELKKDSSIIQQENDQVENNSSEEPQQAFATNTPIPKTELEPIDAELKKEATNDVTPRADSLIKIASLEVKHIEKNKEKTDDEKIKIESLPTKSVSREEEEESPKVVSKKEAKPKKEAAVKLPESDFDIGLSLYKKGNYGSALLYFKNAESDGNNPKHIDAIYYSALSNKGLNKTGKAKRLFKQVIKADGKYKKEAEKELENL